MNTRGGPSSSLTMAFAVSFNSTRTSFVVAHDTGFSVFRARDGDKTSSTNLASLKYAAMIGDSPYLGVASLFGHQPGMTNFDLGVYDARQGTMMASRDDVKDVRAMHLTEERIIVICRTATIFYDINTFERVAVIDTAENETGICSVGASKVVLPGRRAGQVQVVELTTGRALQIISAHQSAIRAVDLSEDENYLATASDNGTLFRIFILPGANKVAELRRGIEQAKVYNIKMSPDNAFLAATSEKGTVHVFSLGSEPTEGPNERAYTPGSRESGTPEPVAIQSQARKTSLSSSPVPAGRPASATFPSSSPATRATPPSHVGAGSPAEYVLVDASGSSPKATSKHVPTSKYSGLSKLPFAPSFMKAHYPDASSLFNVGPLSAAASAQELPGPPTRGQIKWLDEDTFVVVRVQPTVFWEKFRMSRSPIDGALEVNRSACLELPVP